VNRNAAHTTRQAPRIWPSQAASASSVAGRARLARLGAAHLPYSRAHIDVEISVMSTHQVVVNLGRIHHDQPTALRSKSSFQRTRSRTHSSDPSVPPRFASPSDHAAAQGTCDSSRSARSQPPQQPCRQGFVHRWPMRSPTQHRCAQPTPPDSSLLFLPHTTDN